MSCGCNGPMVGGKRKKNRRGTRKMIGGEGLLDFFGFGDSSTIPQSDMENGGNCRKWYQPWKRNIPPCQTEQREQPALPALPEKIGGSGCVYSSENRQYKKSKSKKSKKSRKSRKSTKSRKSRK